LGQLIQRGGDVIGALLTEALAQILGVRAAVKPARAQGKYITSGDLIAKDKELRTRVSPECARKWQGVFDVRGNGVQTAIMEDIDLSRSGLGQIDSCAFNRDYACAYGHVPIIFTVECFVGGAERCFQAGSGCVLAPGGILPGNSVGGEAPSARTHVAAGG